MPGLIALALGALPSPVAMIPTGFGVQSVQFPNSLQLTDWTSDFATDGGTNYPYAGWGPSGSTNVFYPALFRKSETVQSTIVQKVDPAGDLYDFSAALFRAFIQEGLTSTGTWTAISPDGSPPLAAKVFWFDKNSDTYRGPYYAYQPSTSWQGTFWTTGNEDVYVVWDTPFGSTRTRKRIDWSVRNAHDAASIDQAAQKIHDAIGDPVDPPYEPHERPIEQGIHWKLLDGNKSGECDEQADLLGKAMNMLGIAASIGKVYASTDSIVTALETRDAVNEFPNGQAVDHLILYWDTAPNAFEGYCEVNGKFYAVWPKVVATSALDLLRRLGTETGAVQKWIHLEAGWSPGQTTGTGWANHILHTYPDPVPFP